MLYADDLCIVSLPSATRDQYCAIVLYILLLDASKAFDRVEYVKLVNTLRNPKIVLRLIIEVKNQEIQVK